MSEGSKKTGSDASGRPISPGAAAAASMSVGARPQAKRPGKKRRQPKTKVGKKTNELLAHPLAFPLIALLSGLLLAGAHLVAGQWIGDAKRAKQVTVGMALVGLAVATRLVFVRGYGIF